MSSAGAIGNATQQATGERAEELYGEQLASVFRRRDRVFAVLFAAQWAFAIAIALLWSPYGWEGKVRSPHLHLYYALFFGALLSLPPILLVRARPGSALTRHTVAVAQMSWSALLIHLSGGRIETHFHVFGSLAFLAFYRDWKVLGTATVVVAADHLARGLLWSESVYGISNPEWWRFLEHAFWVLFENVVLVMGIVHSHREMRSLAQRQAELEAMNHAFEARVEERTQELSDSKEQYRALLETTKTIPWEWNRSENRFTYVGPQILAAVGVEAEECLVPGFLPERLHPDDREGVLATLGNTDLRSVDFEFRLPAAQGRWLWLRMIGDASSDASVGQALVLRGVMLDVTRSREMEVQLRQAQKLESVGRLAAGVAHEINTPVQFVSDSLHFVREASADLSGLIEKYRAVNRSILDGSPSPDLAGDVVEAEADADLDYLLDNMPRALDRSLEGLGRVATIVRSMKEFAHPDQKTKSSVNLNQAILSTLTIATNEYKYVAEVETDLGEIPPVTCHAGEVNQAVLNILVNAAHAIGDVVKDSGNKGLIRITTRLEGDSVVISIRDTGGGIPESIRDRIFDPFFTTKEVGKGTGQGLAIARTVIREKHGGDLTFETEPGAGTVFCIRLPVGTAASHAA
jgi:two-component system, NtrC family, sensor kinase